MPELPRKLPPRVVNTEFVPEVARTSPKGRFSIVRQDFSGALGMPQDAPPEAGGHPFAVERHRVPGGCQNFPLHAHAAQWEFYLVESGEGKLVTDSEEVRIRAGDFFMCRPGEAHALASTSQRDLVYLVIATNTLTDLVHYPLSNKWLAKPGRHVFRESIDYYDGEE